MSILAAQEGEKNYTWAIQNGDDISTRVGLPDFIGREVGTRACRFANEHDKWQKTIENRAIEGRELTTSQQQSYNAWTASCNQRLIFCRKRKLQIQDAKQVNRNCISFNLRLSEQPSELTLSTGSAGATPFRLVRLCSQEATATEIPSVLDEPTTVEDLQNDEEEHEDAMECEGEPQEDDVHALADEQLRVNMERERDQEDECLILADSDDEVPVPAGGPVPVRVKSFHRREEWLSLECKGLTDLPRHIGGCFILYHSSTQVWKGQWGDVREVGFSDQKNGSRSNHHCNQGSAKCTCDCSS